MAIRALILIEGTRSNGPLYVKAAQRLGLHPITLSADPARYDYHAPISVEAIRVNTDKLEALIHECSLLRATYEIAGITSADELVYATVGKLCRHLNLPGPNPESVERCCNKFTQRQLLAEAGVPIPAYHLAANATEVERAGAEIGLPVIVKPAVGHGSIGVRLCRDADELAEHAAYLLGGKHMSRSSPKILVEEFAQGPYYSADIMGNEVIGIAAGDFGPLPHFVFRGYSHPAPLNDGDFKRIADVSLSCLRALDLGWGPTNIEFRWTKRGPVVIEVNPRLAGGPNPRLVQLAYGVDLVTEHIKLAIGEEWNLSRRQSNVAAARFLIADRDGVLDWISNGDHAAAVPGVAEVALYVNAKTPIVRKGDYQDRIGHVVAASPTRTQTAGILERAVDLIDWSISPFPTLGEKGQSAASHLQAAAQAVLQKR
ncbi:MAG: ATP-grasp domain-containing protein [Mesorhizobium sp.]|uniref:ATP-grasp domain-containing protein n=1 Tax=Mesorhizobium sp. TaxID=1871066 RepID=UPI000FE2FB0B|nr:acetyl-CoA carboxylase biotin carboxylase subunit family protein [Mesorhizobium sp.]RWJ04006.1 MAG: ATP-grasp domain-containing protein [Mesorhizobium sp.]RWJ15111.1 MAG: ATP-grasp domain-containing protein [Mesorhizobium sp.]RWJ76063.1 MAG: ATP-grasp domain-containing protein [Mesorhizobium sp.]